MHRVLLEIWQRIGKTIVFVTHDISEAISLADRIAVMSSGPCSMITRLIDVDLTRPRNLADHKVAQMFGEIEELLTPDLLKLEQNLQAN
jgi:NitT/TauT family transport system ATP-binding protein